MFFSFTKVVASAQYVVSGQIRIWWFRIVVLLAVRDKRIEFEVFPCT